MALRCALMLGLALAAGTCQGAALDFCNGRAEPGALDASTRRDAAIGEFADPHGDR